MPKDRFEAENEGIDIIIDCTGVPAALEKAIQWTKMGATIMVFGYLTTASLRLFEFSILPFMMATILNLVWCIT